MLWHLHPSPGAYRREGEGVHDAVGIVARVTRPIVGRGVYVQIPG